MAAKTIDLSHEGAAVLIFVQPGCGACDDFVPILAPRAQAYRMAGLKVILLNLASADAAIQAAADQYQVRATPTTIVVRRGAAPLRIEGAVDARSVDHILSEAYRWHNHTRP